MVSGEIPNYKSNKGYYSAPSSHAPSSLSSGKRYPGNALRPWPPMYRSPMNRAQMATYQALSTAPPPAKLNYNNNFNGNHYGYNNSIYGRTNKFNFHQFNMVAAAAADSKYAAAMNLANNHNNANKKNAKNYYLISQPYMKNTLAMPSPPPSNGSSGSFYGRTTADYNTNNGNLILMAPNDKDKNRFRKLRNPTQTSPVFQSSCATCIRSKSMEDVRTEIVTDWPTYNKENYNEFKKNRLNNNGLLKHGMRRSMDNLLEVETTNLGKRFQVGITNINKWSRNILQTNKKKHFLPIIYLLVLCLFHQSFTRFICWHHTVDLIRYCSCFCQMNCVLFCHYYSFALLIV